MGIGRREFLKFAVAALRGLAFDPARTITVSGDHFVNARLGLGFVKPQGWVFQAFRDFAAELEGQIVHGLPPGEEQEFCEDQAANLVATVAKYGEEARRFGPSITVFKNREDYPSARSDGLERLALDAIAEYPKLLRAYEVIEAPRRCEISLCSAVRFKSRWLFEHRDMEPVLIEDESLAIDQGSLLYSIHLYDSPMTGEAACEEFACFVQSLRIA